MKRIPFFDIKTQYGEIGDEVRGAIESVFDSGTFILGRHLEEFEAAFASYLGVRHCVGVNSGTDAIRLALAALGIGPGDEVVTVPNTAIPTVAAIRAAGAVPVFVDIDPATCTMDPARLEVLLKRTAADGKLKAVVPVHLYGQTAPMGAIMDIARAYGLKVIEDACQAHGAEHMGAKAGSMGDLGCFSFYPTKNLGGYGDGGAVVTDDPELDDRLRLLRNYGQRDRYHASMEGVNSRLDEIQAAVLLVKLAHLDEWNGKRRALAEVYDESLDPGHVTRPVRAEWAGGGGGGGGGGHVYHLYVIRHPERDALKEYLADNGVSTLIHYPVPLHLQEAYSYLNLPAGSFPLAEKAAATVLSLPIYPELDPSCAESVSRLVNGFPG